MSLAPSGLSLCAILFSSSSPLCLPEVSTRGRSSPKTFHPELGWRNFPAGPGPPLSHPSPRLGRPLPWGRKALMSPLTGWVCWSSYPHIPKTPCRDVERGRGRRNPKDSLLLLPPRAPSCSGSGWLPPRVSALAHRRARVGTQKARASRVCRFHPTPQNFT